MRDRDGIVDGGRLTNVSSYAYDTDQDKDHDHHGLTSAPHSSISHGVSTTTTIIASGGGLPYYISCCLHCCCIIDPTTAPMEVTGLAVDMFARATVLMSSLFLGPALLELATRAAAMEACTTVDQETTTCPEQPDARIYGFRPSSLLSNIAILSGLVTSLLLPFFGALVDHTPYRKHVGGYTAAILVIIKATEIMVGTQTWFLVAWLQVLSGIVVSFHTTATYAYTSELSADAAVQAHYNTTFYVVLFVSSILFLVVVLIPSYVYQLEDVGTARLALAVTFVTGAILFSYAWTYLFRHRPAKSRVPDGMSLGTAGFRKNIRTWHRIQTRFPTLIWLLVGVAFAEAATSALVTIATTYLKDALEMDSNEIGVVFLIVLICGIPGSKLAGYLASTRQLNPIHNIFLCYALFTATTCASAVFMTRPEEKDRAFLFGGLWGVGLGWLHPIHTAAYISLVEKGQEAEMMGIFLLVCNVLTWLPPLTFTLLNEAGFPMSLGMASLNLYFVIAFVCLLAMGKYEDALDALHAASEELIELKVHALM